MLITEFMEDLEDSYNGKYSKTNFNEIKSLITDLEEDQIANLYKHIKYNYNNYSLPTMSHIKGYINALGYSVKGRLKTESYQLHPQSPFQQVIKHKHRSIEWLVKACNWIRKRDNNNEQLESWEISFIAYWENLKSVPEEFRQTMKDLIIENDGKAQLDLIAEVGEKIKFKDLNMRSI
jgi:hypothetical protein